MNRALSPAERYALDTQHYEREDVVDFWLNNYALEKERQFIKYLDRFIPKDQVRLLDVGCGVALHTSLWHERNKLVTASDLSTRFQNYILCTYPFPFIRMDVLNCNLTEQYDVCFCMAVATIVLDEERRFQTFKTLARLVRPGSYLILITGSNQWLFDAVSQREVLHSVDQRDLRKLEQLGFHIEHVLYWSSSPRFLWRSPLLSWLGRGIEAVTSRLGIGARKIVICRRSLNDPYPTLV